MKILFFGTNSFSKIILEGLLKENFIEVTGVVTKSDNVIFNKREPSLVKKYGLENKLLVFDPVSLKASYEEILAITKPDILITASYGNILPKSLLEKVYALNVHASLLPKYRGASPIQSAILNNDKITGCTIMKMEYKLDSGDIIKSGELVIEEDDNYSSLEEKLAYLGRDLLIDTLKEYLDKKVLLTFKQDESKVTFTHIIPGSFAKIDFHDLAINIVNKVRTLSKTPGSIIFVKNKLVKLYKVKISDIIINGEVGEILLNKKQLFIKALDFWIEILEIKESGKKEMDIVSYLNGQSLFKNKEKIDILIKGEENEK
ncbi:MAG: methionyl-tRNA formyltransferase [Acholeplasmatales bacterium]|jgi:methionyl-tRNA formyltransferase|nr:methionyl-tRNA formyltransferase [Acholeplasmatales bacterium]